MIGPLFWLIYLLTYSDTECALLGSRRFGVNMAFSDEDQILMENLYVFKGYGAKKFIKEFLKKVCRLGDWRNFRKAVRNWHHGMTKWQHCKDTEYLLFFYCIIFIHKLDIIRKEHVICLQIFSAAIMTYIIKIGQHLTD